MRLMGIITIILIFLLCSVMIIDVLTGEPVKYEIECFESDEGIIKENICLKEMSCGFFGNYIQEVCKVHKGAKNNG